MNPELKKDIVSEDKCCANSNERKSHHSEYFDRDLHKV